MQLLGLVWASQPLNQVGDGGCLGREGRDNRLTAVRIIHTSNQTHTYTHTQTQTHALAHTTHTSREAFKVLGEGDCPFPCSHP